MARRTQAEVDEAVQSLRENLPRGSKLWVIVRHVSRTGSSRDVSVLVQGAEEYGKYAGEFRPTWLTYHVRRALGLRMTEGAFFSLRLGYTPEGVAQHLASRLGRLLYDDSKALRAEVL